MNHKEHGLVEDIWYIVQLHDDDFYSSPYPPIKVEGKFRFIGKLIVHVGNTVVFNLQDGKGSVVLPFEFIKWMVPLYKPEKKEQLNWRDHVEKQDKIKKEKKEEYNWEWSD